MKPHLVIVLLGMALVPCIGLSKTQRDKPAFEENSLEEWRLLKKPLEKQALEKKVPVKRPGANGAKPLVVKAQQVLEVFEAIGDAAVELVGGPGAIRDPLELQLAPQFGHLLKAELRFARTVCQPTPEQYKTLKTSGDAGLKVAVKKCADVQRKMQQGIRSGQRLNWPDPRKIIADKMVISVKQTLSAEQAERYQLELNKRAAARKRATLLNLIAKLDQDLLLTAEQRTHLTETLNSNWNDDWEQQMEVFLYGAQYLPVLPNDQVLPILNEMQKEIWKGMPKNQNKIGAWLGFGFLQPGVFPDEVEVPMVVDDAHEKNRNEKNRNKKDDEPKGDKP